MQIESILYYVFSSIAIVSALMVIFAQNPVHSILFLILTFCNSSFIMFLIGAEFLGLIFIMVYVGAIAVLFLFVIMMLDIRRRSKEKSLFWDIFLTVIVGLIFFIEMFFMIESTYVSLDSYTENSLNNLGYVNLYYALKFKVLGGLKILGLLLYTHYSYYFFISGLVLLVAMIGAIILTLNKNDSVRRQADFEQLNRDFKAAVFLKNPVN
jgi:NADH:ubiquinone oxidoreductase subunit 6 (subunit J)